MYMDLQVPRLYFLLVIATDFDISALESSQLLVKPTWVSLVRLW